MDGECQKCNAAKATVHILETYPTKRERHLCDDCATKEGVIFKQGPETANEVLKQFIKHKVGMTSKADDLACSGCGTTFREFQSRGLLGCRECYDAFSPVLTPLIQKAHAGGTHHVGKVPAGVDQDVRRQTGLLRLKRELAEAIEAENYELAASVRDKIRQLESV